MAIDLSWLKSFVSLARTRNFATSARQNNITQSAFSRRIRALETWVGADLIDRSTYPTTLTQAGERFLQVASEINRQLNEVRTEIAEEQSGASREIVVTAQHTLSLTHLPRLLDGLSWPERPVLSVIHAETLHDCVNRLEAGNADLLIAYSPDTSAIELEGLDLCSVEFDYDRLVPVVAPDESGRPLYALAPETDEPIPWLSYGQEAMLEQCVTPLINRRSGHLRPVVRTPISEVLRRFAVAGFGVVWLPESLIGENLARGELVEAGDPDWRIALPVSAYCPARSRNPVLATLWNRLGA